MLVTTERPTTGIRVNELGTPRAVAGTYLRHGSPQLMLAAAALTIAARVVIGGWHVADVAAIVFVIAIVGPFEWLIHKYLLHAPVDSWQNRVLATGVGHRRHHLDPPDLTWLMLRPIDVVVYAPVIALMMAGMVLPVLWLVGAPLLGPYLTVLGVSYLTLAHYEWTHLLVHSRYRPKSRYYARLARNHRLHHFRNEQYWLGVTANTGDRLLGTLPAHKTDVPLSDTARTLGSSPIANS